MATVTVVGLGPAGRSLLTVGALEAIRDARVVVVRTSRHPAASDLAAEGVAFEDCDDLYDSSASLDEAYESITARVLDHAAEGDLVYAVPGSPHVAEATVRLLRERAPGAGVGLEFVEGVSFLEPVLAATGFDPAQGGVLLADGRRLAVQLAAWFPPGSTYATPALVVFQVDRATVLSDAKLALLECLPPEHPVSLVVGAGGPDCEVHTGPLAELDWGQVDPGDLASLFVPARVKRGGFGGVAARLRRTLTRLLRTPRGTRVKRGGFGGVAARLRRTLTRLLRTPRGTRVKRGDRPFVVAAHHLDAGRAFADLVALQDRLRSPGGCPWDAEQTHASLSRHLLEETYEVLDVLDRFPPDAPPAEVDPHLYALLEEELGDFVMQAVFHARLAEEAGAFDAARVVDGIVDKLVERHPHVFGTAAAGSGEEVVKNWEDQKKEKKRRESVLDDIPATLPALSRATKVVRRTRAAGLDWADPEANVHEARARLEALQAGTASATAVAEAVGHVLLAISALADTLGTDPEAALRAAQARFEQRFRSLEASGTDGLRGTPARSLISVDPA